MSKADAEARAAPDSGALVWHYTSLEALHEIVKTNSLLATEVSYQNDISETTTADDAFNAALERFDDVDPAFVRCVREGIEIADSGVPSDSQVETASLLSRARFILCASADGDSLYAWRTYGGAGLRCAIGLDRGASLGIVTSRTDRGSVVTPWTKVTYDREQVEAYAADQIKRLLERWDSFDAADPDEVSRRFFEISMMDLPGARSLLRAAAKEPSFSDEREWRVTVEPHGAEAIFVSPSTMGPKPRMRLRAAAGWGESVSESAPAPRLPIRAIRLAPGSGGPSVLSGVRWLLMTNGYPIDHGYAEVGVDERGGIHFSVDWSETVLVSASDRPYRAV